MRVAAGTPRHGSHVALCLIVAFLAWAASNPPDILMVPPDLKDPPISSGAPGPGRQVLESLPAYAGTEVAHALYLPEDWAPGRTLPLLIEYRGNGKRVRDGGGLGYGLSGGKGFIWAVLPFVGNDHQTDADWWWGDVEATVAYAKQAVPFICRRYGGDPARVVLVGMSRGAIACNYIGLYDAGIARLWRAMIAVSHYDNQRWDWGMTPLEKAQAPERMRRLGSTPQLICGEFHLPLNHRDETLLKLTREGGFTTFEEVRGKLGLVPMTEEEGIRAFVARTHPKANTTFLDLPYVNHSTEYVLRDIPERKQMRDWIRAALSGPDPVK